MVINILPNFSEVLFVNTSCQRNMNFVLATACFAGLLALSSAHMCLISPQQRGSMMGLNKPGANDCILLNAPCGGRPMESPMVNYNAGSNISVILQKNLDHWASATPGYFAVTIMQGTMSKEIGRVADMGEPSLHLYTVMGMIPADVHGRVTLQATYVTMNPQAPAVFYQCADVLVH